MTATGYSCFRCGASLAAMTLPFSRRDACPSCGAWLHACRMCERYDRTLAKQCAEEGAEEVMDKEQANFCEWFSPRAGAFDPAGRAEEELAREALARLFGETPATEADSGDGDGLTDAERLFR